MKLLSLLLILIGVFSFNDASRENSAKEKKGAYYISGTLKDGAGTMMNLDILEMGAKIKPLMVQEINKEDKFDFEGTADGPQFMQLRYSTGSTHLIVRPGDNISLDIISPSKYEVKGSPESLHLLQIYLILEKANDKKYRLQQEIEKIEDERKKAKLQKGWTARYQRIEKEKFGELKDYISTIGNSYSALIGLGYFTMDYYEYLKKMDLKFAAEYSETWAYKSLHNRIVEYEKSQKK